MKANFETGLKVCSHCKRELPLSMFPKALSSPDGLYCQCKECKKKSDFRWRRSEKGRSYTSSKSLIWRLENPEKRKEVVRKYNQKKRFCQTKNSRSYILSKLRVRLRRILQRIGSKKAYKTLDLLGCSMKDFRNYIESQFEPGMTWENHGYRGWHIDHIIPISYFDLSDPEQQKLCFNYRNLQPLWWKDNRKKSDKVPGNVEELVEFLKQEITIS